MERTTVLSSSRIAAIIAVLGMLAAFAPMSTDMYLPAFHIMASHFEVPEGNIELTLSAFFLGLAIGQAFYGPFIDRFGRRGPLLAGIGLYIVATIGCLVAPNIGIFTALRFLQAVGGSAGMIIGRAIVRDLFDSREAARALSLLIMVMTLGPIIAPVLGGFIVTHSGWQEIFLAMLGFGLICGILVWFGIPETLCPDQRQVTTLSGTLHIWMGLMRDRAFSVPALAGGFAQACMFAFITGSPFVFINLHGVSAQSYGLLFALIACALIVSAQINRILLHHFPPEFIMKPALLLNVFAGAAAVLAVSTNSLPALLVPLWFAIGALGFIGANAAAIAMEASGENAGSGSSLVGVLQFGFAFIVSSLVAASQNGTAYPMTLGILGCGAIATIMWLFMTRDRENA